MADGSDTKADQIIGRQLRKDFGVDVVGCKCGSILLEAKSVQPTSNIDRHRRPLSIWF